MRSSLSGGLREGLLLTHMVMIMLMMILMVVGRVNADHDHDGQWS